jgi:thermolysin
VLPPLSSPDAALTALEVETGHRWTLRRDAGFGTIAFLDGRTAPLAATAKDAERAARLFLSQHSTLFSLSDPDAELATTAISSDELGMSHARFSERVGRIPVWGAELAVHFDTDGALVRVNGHYTPIGVVDMVPEITADAARVTAAVLARAARPAADPNIVTTSAADLYVYPVADAYVAPGDPRPARLAWHVLAYVEEAQPPLVLEALIDAKDGSLLAASDRLATMAGTGVGVFGERRPLVIAQKKTDFWLEDATRGQTPLRTFSAHDRLKLPGSELRSNDPNAWDDDPTDGVPGAAVDAHAHVATSWDYFSHVLGREGWDDEGTGVRTVVHFGDGYPNAFFDGAQLVFGDGDASMTSPAAALDVVAHEYTHGVLAATARLVGDGEPGAIAEGLADLFGCLVSYGSGEGDRWQIGETIHHPRGLRNRGIPLRDLRAPHVTGQPMTIAEIDPASDDPSHTNASIVGHLGYLLVEGASADEGLLPVVAVGPDLAAKVFYRAFGYYLLSRAGFVDFADALEVAAQDLGGGLPVSVRAALIRVGLR